MTTTRAADDQSAQPTQAAADEVYTGTVKLINPQEHEIRVRGWWLLPPRTFVLGAHCACLVPGRNPGTFDDLRVGQKVTVSYQNAQGVLVADRVKQDPMRFTGMVAEIDPARHTLTLRRRGLDKSFQIAGDCAVEMHGSRTGTLAEIQPGNHVTVTYETPDDKAVARLIAQTSQEFTGRLTVIDLDDRTVTAKGRHEEKTFHLGENCAIVFSGKTGGRLADLRPKENLVFSYDQVNGVNVVNRIALGPDNGQSAYVAPPVSTYGPYPGY